MGIQLNMKMLTINQNTNPKVVILKRLISMWKSLKLSMNMWSTKKNHKISTNNLLRSWMLNRKSPGLDSYSKVPLEELPVCWILCFTRDLVFLVQNAQLVGLEVMSVLPEHILSILESHSVSKDSGCM